MARYLIRIIGGGLDAVDDGNEYASADDALACSIRAALQIGEDEIIHGATTICLDARVEGEDGTIARRLVSLNVEPLPV